MVLVLASRILGGMGCLRPRDSYKKYVDEAPGLQQKLDDAKKAQRDSVDRIANLETENALVRLEKCLPTLR
jgi:hypothetical protein